MHAHTCHFRCVFDFFQGRAVVGVKESALARRKKQILAVIPIARAAIFSRRRKIYDFSERVADGEDARFVIFVIRCSDDKSVVALISRRVELSEQMEAHRHDSFGERRDGVAESRGNVAWKSRGGNAVFSLKHALFVREVIRHR